MSLSLWASTWNVLLFHSGIFKEFSPTWQVAGLESQSWEKAPDSTRLCHSKRTLLFSSKGTFFAISDRGFRLIHQELYGNREKRAAEANGSFSCWTARSTAAAPPCALKPLYNWSALWTDLLRDWRMEKPSSLPVWLADDGACSRFWMIRDFMRFISTTTIELPLWKIVFGLISICVAGRKKGIIRLLVVLHIFFFFHSTVSKL